MYIPNKYPGAAVQSHLLNSKFADFLLKKTPTAVGSFLGGEAGAVGGQWLGEKLSNAASRGKQIKQLEKEIKTKENKTKLEDIGKE